LTTVAIIGAGPFGRSLALRAARAGFRVFLEDVLPANLQQARDSIHRELTPKNPPGIDSAGFDPPRIAFVSSVEDAVREADLVIDCVPDELESKLEILWLVDRMAPPRTVVATPTLNLSIADLAGCTNRPEKCLAIAASLAGLAVAMADDTSRAAPAGGLDSSVPPMLLLRAAPSTSEESSFLAAVFFRRLGFAAVVERGSA